MSERPEDSNSPELAYLSDDTHPEWTRILIVVVAVFCIAAAFIAPNLLPAKRRGGQMRTMANLRALGTAVEAYAEDHNAYPPGKTTVAELEPYLVPDYIKNLPLQDYWGNDLQYVSDSQ